MDQTNSLAGLTHRRRSALGAGGLTRERRSRSATCTRLYGRCARSDAGGSEWPDQARRATPRSPSTACSTPCQCRTAGWRQDRPPGCQPEEAS
jgi:hypothetical protein